MYTANAHMHGRSLSWLDSGISIKSGGVKLVLLVLTVVPLQNWIFLGGI